MSSWLCLGPSPGLSRLVRVLPSGLVTAPATHFEIGPCRGPSPRLRPRHLPSHALQAWPCPQPRPRGRHHLAPPPTAARAVSPPLATPPDSSRPQPRLPGLVLVQCPGLRTSSGQRAGGSLGPDHVPAEGKPKLSPGTRGRGPRPAGAPTPPALWGAPGASPRVPLAKSGNACRRDHGDLG